MKNTDNIKLLDFSLKNPEPIIDEFYLKDHDLIISNDFSKTTELMQKNADLIESISAYNFGKKNKNAGIIRKTLDKILEIVSSENINYSEFVSFWPVVDISHSVFMKIDKDKQRDILQNIVEQYIKLRHEIYLKYGYTPTTLQVSKDAKTHKQGGNLGINKVSKILDSKGFKKANSEIIEDFIQGDKKYIETDKKGKKLFKELLKYYGIKFLWSSKKEKKMPDFLIRYEKDIFIVEHKHKKEGGGGQNGQINEILSLISFRENNSNVHFVSFLDGVYFNLFANNNSKKGKIFEQFNSITKSLKKNKQNYFVNTAGFKKLLDNLN
jgi:hypothetical protein